MSPGRLNTVTCVFCGKKLGWSDAIDVVIAGKAKVHAHKTCADAKAAWQVGTPRCLKCGQPAMQLAGEDVAALRR